MSASQSSDGGAPAEPLRAWYRPRRSAYPWRRSRDPYLVLVSEVMLQQTQAARVAPAFERFVSSYCSVASLAAASRADVVRSWAGLGYNRRAVALSEAARAIERDHGGSVPSDPAVLRTLPGVGPYTAAAVASVAFGLPVAAVDTNVRRIVARVHFGVEPNAMPPARLREIASTWLNRDDPGGWNQALMDLGREVCRPRPRCDACPLAPGCRFLASGATPSPSPRRQTAFGGSSRQVRGAIVRVLRARRSVTLASLARLCGFEARRVHEAVLGLHADGLLVAGPSALSGDPAGRARLAG